MEKSWQDFVWVLAQGVCRRAEQHPAAGDEAAGLVGVAAAEVGELHELLAVEQEQLGHEAAIHSRPVGKEDIQGVWVRAGDLELRDDAPTAGQRDGRNPSRRILAISLDGKSHRRGTVEENRSAVEEALAADGHFRVLRELASLAGSQVEKRDLWLRPRPRQKGRDRSGRRSGRRG